MATNAFLAMTAAEIAKNTELTSKTAWMACHFSPYSTGLSNLPSQLPEGALLILNDLTPIHGHDPVRIGEQLAERIEALHCCGLLLDFQRPGCSQAEALVGHLLRALSCPVVVSDIYAKGIDTPVFLPPVPPSCPLEEYIQPWTGRELWLDIGLEGEQVTLTEQGAAFTPLPRFAPPGTGHRDEKLHCHYKIEVNEDVRFTLWRTEEDISALVEEAEAMGVTGLVGLYQELHGFAP